MCVTEGEGLDYLTQHMITLIQSELMIGAVVTDDISHLCLGYIFTLLVSSLFLPIHIFPSTLPDHT